MQHRVQGDLVCTATAHSSLFCKDNAVGFKQDTSSTHATCFALRVWEGRGEQSCCALRVREGRGETPLIIAQDSERRLLEGLRSDEACELAPLLVVSTSKRPDISWLVFVSSSRDSTSLPFMPSPVDFWLNLRRSAVR